LIWIKGWFCDLLNKNGILQSRRERERERERETAREREREATHMPHTAYMSLLSLELMVELKTIFISPAGPVGPPNVENQVSNTPKTKNPDLKCNEVQVPI
jgi:hypothetical protein